MDLVNILAGDIVKKHKFGCAVARIDNLAFLRACWNPDMKFSHGWDLLQRFKTFNQFAEVFF